jgi:hypothetical protein
MNRCKHTLQILLTQCGDPLLKLSGRLQTTSYVYFEEELGRRSAAKLAHPRSRFFFAIIDGYKVAFGSIDWLDLCVLGEVHRGLQIIFEELIELSDARYLWIDPQVCQFILHRGHL